ncbi:hypothetical protein [Oharaeibacter diazotrophicus]|uniref:hypothetical protein n=1 Tax=Oharaeibacter diazotrophicus TaxID=1920512 RepID=UPI000F82613D|nr:hypothetical protein [Oharaeibacter diazotrophicus]GLS75737.1 hypothetical protein GCM10007904_10720 [Oharaeibacter diazotrophicus]
MSNIHENSEYARHKELQLNGKTNVSFVPCSSRAFEASEIDYKVINHSFGGELIRSYRHRVAPIIFLNSTAKAMMLEQVVLNDPLVGPSEVFSIISGNYISIIDSAIDKLPLDLLILYCRNPIIDLRDFDNYSNAIAECQSLSDDAEFMNSYFVMQVNLMKETIERVGSFGYELLRRALTILLEVSLFEQNEVNIFALDIFPCLNKKQEDLKMKNFELQWKSEEF